MRILAALSQILFVIVCLNEAHGHFTAKGHMHTHAETIQEFLNPNCEATDSCDLKRFTLKTSVYETWFSDDPKNPTYSNGVIMEYETDSVAAIDKYAIVQFIKGCVFYTARNGKGEISRRVSDTITNFNEDVPYCFPNWVIDSQDPDPAYNSDPQYGRSYLLRWNKPGSYDHRTHKYFGAEKPRKPVVYLTDYPSGAFIGGTSVKNAALQFNTCIFKANEVPTEAKRHEINFAQPINCFQWQNIYVYDFDKAAFRTDVAAIPTWDEPPTPTEREPLVMAMILILVLGLVLTFALRRFRLR